MNRLLAIILMLFALLPQPAVLAAVWTAVPDCAPKEECRPVCACCPGGGSCECVMQEQETPAPPQTPAPVRGTDFYPVPVLPPVEMDIPRVTVQREERAVSIPSAADRARKMTLVPLHVRHCAFLI